MSNPNKKYSSVYVESGTKFSPDDTDRQKRVSKGVREFGKIGVKLNVNPPSLPPVLNINYPLQPTHEADSRPSATERPE